MSTPRCVRSALRIQGASWHPHLGTDHRSCAGGGRGEGMTVDEVKKTEAAILYEGYLLYPYRPAAVKNRQRWNFGTLYPRIYAEAQHPAEPFRLVAECLAMADANATLDVRISFLQLVPTQVADKLTA